MALQFGILAVTSLHRDCTLLWDDEIREAVLIGMGGDVLLVLNGVAIHRLDVKEIWLTHGHLNHAGRVVEFLSHKDVPVVGPRRDNKLPLDSLPDTTAQYGFPVSSPSKSTRWLEGGDVLNVGRYRFDALHIPGHMPRQMMLHCVQAGPLVVGDVLFYESISRIDLPRGSHADLIDNIRRKPLVLPDDTQVITGHGRMTTTGHEKWYSLFL